MVSILNFIVVFTMAVCSLLAIKYFVITAIDTDTHDLWGQALRIVGCVLSAAAISWFITFIWLVRTDFIEMKIFLWVREVYFTIQSGRLLELLLS